MTRKRSFAVPLWPQELAEAERPYLSSNAVLPSSDTASKHRGCDYRQHLIDRASFPILVSDFLQRMLGGIEGSRWILRAWLVFAASRRYSAVVVVLGRAGAVAIIDFLAARLGLALLQTFGRGRVLAGVEHRRRHLDRFRTARLPCL
jgi:hypothetical protein